MEEETLTAKEAARMLDVSERHITRMIVRQELPARRNPVYRKGGRWEIRLAEVLALLPEPDRAAALSRLHSKQV